MTYVGGTTGESVTLSLDERKHLLEAWLEAAAPLRTRVIAQIGGVPLPEVLEMAKFSEEKQVSCIMTLPEIYYKPKSAAQVVSYLETVARAAPTLPLLYYHFAMMSGVELNVPEFFSMASSRIPNFKGMKADLGVAVQVTDLLRDDQRVYIGNHDNNEIIAPVFAPIDDSGHLNLSIIPEYIKYLTDHDITTVLVGGTTGESVTLSLDERKHLLEAWLEAAAPLRTRVIAQIGGVPLPEVLEMAKFSEEKQVSCIMTLPEIYYKPKSAAQVVSYLETVARAAPTLPLLYYHFAMMSGVELNVPEFFSMASSRIPNFKGMKADLGVAVQVTDLLRDDQRIYIGNHMLAPAVLLGHESSIATVTNMFPRLSQDIVAATKRGEVSKVRELQNRMNRLVSAIASQGEFLPAMKAAMVMVTGIKVGSPRQPMAALDQRRRSNVEDNLRKLGVDIVD